MTDTPTPDLTAELESEKRLNENLRQIERNVQAERERQFQRAEAAEARVKELEGANAALRSANDMLLRAALNAGDDNAG